MKSNINKCLIIFIIVITILFTNVFWNVISMIEGSGYIPSKSNIFIFEITQFDQGSGAYWRYGEDRNYYYHFSLYEENVYFYINKESNCPNLNKLDFKTWCNPIKVYQKHSQ